MHEAESDSENELTARRTLGACAAGNESSEESEDEDGKYCWEGEEEEEEEEEEEIGAEVGDGIMEEERRLFKVKPFTARERERM